MLYLLSEGTLLKHIFPESKNRTKKLVSVSTISPSVTETKEEAVETAEGVGKNSEESKDEYPKNLVQVLYIQYPITFWKKFVPVLPLFNLGSKVNVIHPTLPEN